MEFVTAPEALPALEAVHARLRQLWEPPPDILPSDWAEQNLVLRKGTTPRPGPVILEQFQREPLDIFKDPERHEVVYVKPTQIGWSVTLNILVGYTIDVDPKPQMLVQPTSDNAKDYGRKRINPLIADCEALKAKVQSSRRTKGGNTLKLKEYPGGFLKLAGANTGTDLRSDPVPIVLFDEADAYPEDVNGEGEPIEVGSNRTISFVDYKILKGGTPTKPKGISRLEKAFEASDKRRFHVPCPHCGFEQALWWQDPLTKEHRLRYELAPETGEVDPNTVEYVCAGCGRGIKERFKKRMLDQGRWVAEHPGRSVAGFHINGLYRPWKDCWAELCQKWQDAQGDVEKLKEFVTLQLAEFWEERGAALEVEGLKARLENYNADVPGGAALLVCAVDVQTNRLEAAVKAYGPGEESWLIDHRIFWGDPSSDPDVWAELDQFRVTEWRHESGMVMRPLITVIDSGDGGQADAVYDFVIPRQNLRDRVFAIKGVDHHTKPVLVQEGTVRKHQVRLFTVATHAAKERLFSRFQLPMPAADKPFPPGFIHLPHWTTDEYLAQIASEKKVRERDKKRGITRTRWVKTHARNEALDLEVYALAALFILQNFINPALYRDLGKYREVLLSGALAAATQRHRRVRSRGINQD